jgi:integrase/recombinase XerC
MRRLQREDQAQVAELAHVESVFLRRLQTLGRSPNTIKHYESTFALLHRFFDEHGIDHAVSSLTNDAMNEFVLWLRDTPSKAWRGSTTRSVYGISGNLKALRAFCAWLLDEELITRRVKVPLPKTPKRLFPILTDEDIQKIWACEQMRFRGSLGKRNRALLALMFDTGLRRSEICGLRVADVDMDNQLVTVIGKGDKQRRVPFSTACAVLLSEWIRTRGEEEGALFLLKGAGLRMLFCRIKESAGVDLLHPHALRHTAATLMVRANMDLHSVKRVLGHSQLSTTEMYLSLSDQDLREKHQAASPFTAIQGHLGKRRNARLSRD